jgi:hypothetical protein
MRLDPTLSMLPMLPFYQPPEEQGQERALTELPQVPNVKLDRPELKLGASYPPPSLSLNPVPKFGQLDPLTAPPQAIAEALQSGAAPTQQPNLPPGFSWEGQSGRKFELTPEQGARLRAGYQAMQKRMGGSLGSLSEVNKDPAGAASGLMAALSEFMDPQQAAALALKVHEGELDRLSAEERQRLALEARAKRGSGGGTGLVAPKNTDVNAIFDDVSRDVNRMPSIRGRRSEQRSRKSQGQRRQTRSASSTWAALASGPASRTRSTA